MCEDELPPLEKTSGKLYFCKKLEVKAETQISDETGNAHNECEETEAMGKYVYNKLGVPESPRRSRREASS